MWGCLITVELVLKWCGDKLILSLTLDLYRYSFQESEEEDEASEGDEVSRPSTPLARSRPRRARQSNPPQTSPTPGATRTPQRSRGPQVILVPVRRPDAYRITETELTEAEISQDLLVLRSQASDQGPRH